MAVPTKSGENPHIHPQNTETYGKNEHNQNGSRDSVPCGSFGIFSCRQEKYKWKREKILTER